MFVDVWHANELSETGDSYLNTKEAHVVVRIVANLLDDIVIKGTQLKPEQIGVITFYRGQRAQILHQMKAHPSLKKGGLWQVRDPKIVMRISLKL